MLDKNDGGATLAVLVVPRGGGSAFGPARRALLKMRWITLALAALLVLVHAALWFGKGGVPRMMELGNKLVAQKAENDAARHRNEQLTAEVDDLKQGLEMVEEKARFELGMIKPDEIYVQLAPARR